MVQILSKGCHEGTCEHAPFPHKLVESGITVRVPNEGRRGYTSKVIGVSQSVICLACGHWARPGVECGCRYDCHNSGINPEHRVLYCVEDATPTQEAHSG